MRNWLRHRVGIVIQYVEVSKVVALVTFLCCNFVVSGIVSLFFWRFLQILQQHIEGHKHFRTYLQRSKIGKANLTRLLSIIVKSVVKLSSNRNHLRR